VWTFLVLLRMLLEKTPMTDTLSPDRERDAKIAEALGHEVKWLATALMPNVPHYIDREISHGYTQLPDYSTDPVAFETLMQEIGRRGLGEIYVRELMRLLATDRIHEDFGLVTVAGEDIFALIVAEQSKRAAAALAVLTETT
jgi:hypothetical protein